MVKNRTAYSKSAAHTRNGVPAANGKGAKRTIGKPARGVVDARQKIIQKKRTHVVDARDVLASMAKTQDARAKLLKLRGGAPKPPPSVKQIGKHILQKTDKHGKIVLVTSRSKAAASIGTKIREQLGLAGAQRPKRAPVAAAKRKPAGPLQLRRTISNDYTLAPPLAPAMFCPTGYERAHVPAHPHDVYMTGAPGYSAMAPMLAPIDARRPAVDAQRGMVSDAASGTWKTFASPMRANGAFMEVDSDDERESHARSRAVMSRSAATSVHSRLDAQPATHGILAAQAKTKVVVPVGHRIVVSNLQSTVTQDDIRELFEDIGQLIVARLVRPGTAEVIYKNLKDAQKAVDTYHNRQLDGQPMKCLLVNKRPLNNPTAPAIKASDVVRKQMSSNSVEKLVPDLSTIHKVLFQRH